MVPDRNNERLEWRKAGQSAGNGHSVELARLRDGSVLIRDGLRPDEAYLRFNSREWDCFLDGAKNGEFDTFGETGN